jgi:hypothetical protein
MATIAVQDVSANGSIADLTFTAAATTTDDFTNDGRTMIAVKNDDVGSHTVTPDVKKDLGGMVSESGAATTVGASDIALLGPFDKEIFGDSSNVVTLTLDATTSMSFAAFRLPNRL